MKPSDSPSATASSTTLARNRQITCALAIVLLFGIMWPYNEWLNRQKQAKDLGEAAIGQVDSGSFMLKLAMIGGARGIVANALWTQAIELQKMHEWDKLKTTVDFITKLQPHFKSIWTFQGWNLAYNVSVEWDSPEDKYVWIKKGINFLRDGVAKNSKSPDLYWDTGWTYYHKLGFADEAIILRRLFRDDPDDQSEKFKVEPISGETKNDNFQVSHGWFTRAIEQADKEERLSTNIEAQMSYVDKPTQHRGRPGDINFRAHPAQAQTRYAIALEKQSVYDIPPTFGEIARNEWRKALREWETFGDYPFPMFRYEQEAVVRLNNIEPARLKTLDAKGQYWTKRWAEQENFRYWKDRSEAEMTPEGVDARRYFYEGFKALLSGRYDEAKDRYEKGINIWVDVCTKHPVFRDDDLNKKETGHIIKRFVLVLKNLGEEPPADLPFKDFLQAVQDDNSVDPYDQIEVMRSKFNVSSRMQSTPGN